MARRKRYVIEGTWSGYRRSQSRIVHTEVSDSPKYIEWAKSAHAVYYTDGTALYLNVRECKPHEHVKENPAYRELLHDCFYKGFTHVQQFVDERKAKEA